MIRVQVIEDTTLVADAISLALRCEPDFQIVGVASCAAQAMRQVSAVDITLVNIHLRYGGALDVVERLGGLSGAPKVVMMGVTCPEEELLPFLDHGIAGYVLVENNFSEFVETLRMVHRGETVLSPKLAATVMSRLALLAQARERTGFIDPGVVAVRTLTGRECQVIELVGRGFSNQEIAGSLNIEVGTVKNHVHNILRKLDVNSRRSAAALFSRARNQRALKRMGDAPRSADDAQSETGQPDAVPTPRLLRSRRMPA